MTCRPFVFRSRHKPFWFWSHDGNCGLFGPFFKWEFAYKSALRYAKRQQHVWYADVRAPSRVTAHSWCVRCGETHPDFRESDGQEHDGPPVQGM